MYLHVYLNLRLLKPPKPVQKKKTKNLLEYFFLQRHLSYKCLQSLYSEIEKITLSTFNDAVASDNTNKTNRLHRDARSASSELRSAGKGEMRFNRTASQQTFTGPTTQTESFIAAVVVSSAGSLNGTMSARRRGDDIIVLPCLHG